MRAEFLAYFKDLFEGRAQISWHAWFSQHEEELRAELSRIDFLHLKFHNLDEAEQWLRNSGISYTPDPTSVRREKWYAHFHPTVLDEQGRPKEQFLRKAYNGARGHCMDGNVEESRAAVALHLKKLTRYPILRRAEEYEDLQIDGAVEFTLGNKAFGRILLEALAGLSTGNDLLDPAILNARKLLSESPK